ncbi:hypothetical protein ACWGS9_00185 [Bradyrhizobium sp. Arg314]
MNQLATAGTIALPAIVQATDERAGRCFLEFFTAQIRNPNTTRAYVKDVTSFLDWCARAPVTSAKRHHGAGRRTCPSVLDVFHPISCSQRVHFARMIT